MWHFLDRRSAWVHKYLSHYAWRSPSPVLFPILFTYALEQESLLYIPSTQGYIECVWLKGPRLWVLIKKWSAVAWTTWGQLLPWTLVSMEVHHIWKPRVKHHWPVSHTTVLTAVHAIPIVRSFPFHSHMAMVFKLMGRKRKRKKHPLRCFIEEKKHLILCVVKVSLQTVLYAVTMQKACYRRTQRKEEETVCDL